MCVYVCVHAHLSLHLSEDKLQKLMFSFPCRGYKRLRCAELSHHPAPFYCFWNFKFRFSSLIHFSCGFSILFFAVLRVMILLKYCV